MHALNATSHLLAIAAYEIEPVRIALSFSITCTAGKFALFLALGTQRFPVQAFPQISRISIWGAQLACLFFREIRIWRLEDAIFFRFVLCWLPGWRRHVQRPDAASDQKYCSSVNMARQRVRLRVRSFDGKRAFVALMPTPSRAE